MLSNKTVPMHRVFLPHVLIGAISLALAVAASPVAAGEISELLAFAPEGYNAVLAVDAQALFASRLAIAEGWKEKYADAFSSAPTSMPPDSQSFVLAAELDVETFDPHWEAAAVSLASARTVQQIAEKTGGAVDHLGSFDAVWPRADLCVLALSSNRFAMLKPATRQAAARWARTLEGAAKTPPPFLAESIAAVDSGAKTICVAMDLRDVLRPEDVSAAVGRSEILSRVNKEEAAAVLASVVGVRASFQIDSQISGEIVVEFGRNCGVLSGVSGKLIASVMEQAGMVLDDVEKWNFAAKGTSIVGSGAASEATLRRVLSLLSLDATVVSEQDSAALPTPPPPAAPAAPAETPAASAASSGDDRATIRYFKAVSRYIADLQRDAQRRSPDQIAMWMDNYATRIDRLNTRNVDPSVAQFGAWAAQNLHGAVAAMHQAYSDTGFNPLEYTTIETGSLPTGRTVNYGGTLLRSYAPYSRAQVDIGSALRSQKEAEQNFQATQQQAQAILGDVFSATDDMRAQMKERYGEDF